MCTDLASLIILNDTELCFKPSSDRRFVIERIIIRSITVLTSDDVSIQPDSDIVLNGSDCVNIDIDLSDSSCEVFQMNHTAILNGRLSITHLRSFTYDNQMEYQGMLVSY